MSDAIAFLVKIAPYLAELFELSKKDEKAAITEIDARVSKERAAWAKKYGKPVPPRSTKPR